MRSTCITRPKVNGLSSAILASYQAVLGIGTRLVLSRSTHARASNITARAAIFKLEPELELARSDERRNVFDRLPLRCQH